MQTLRMMLFSRKKRKQKSDSKSEKAEHGTFSLLNPKILHTGLSPFPVVMMRTICITSRLQLKNL